MPWVMAAMAAAQMLQGAQNAAEKRKIDSAATRYSPWTGISKLESVPNQEASTAMQGYTGITGQMQNQKTADLQDKYLEARTNRLNAGGADVSIAGGSFMNNPAYHESGYGAAPEGAPVRGYNNPYSNANLWQQRLARSN